VGYVVLGVPGVVERDKVELLGAALGVGEAALPLVFGEGLEEHDPAGVDAFDDVERPLGRGGKVVKLGEGSFVVAGDAGEVFGKGFADAEERGRVGVGDVMDDLADCPAAFAVGGVYFGHVEMSKRLAEKLRHLSESVDGIATIVGHDGIRSGEEPDRIAGIGRSLRGLWSFIDDGRQLRHRVVGSVERLGLRWIKPIVSPAEQNS